MIKLIYLDPRKLEMIEHGRRADGKPHSLSELISEPRGDLSSTVRKCIGRLSPRERQVVRLLLKGDPVREIAKKLKVSESSIYTMRARVVKSLKKKWIGLSHND